MRSNIQRSANIALVGGTEHPCPVCKGSGKVPRTNIRIKKSHIQHHVEHCRANKLSPAECGCPKESKTTRESCTRCGGTGSVVLRYAD